MNASSDLITKLEEMMRTLSAAEAARIIVEAARQAAEEARRQSERQRIQAEIDRNIAEELRQSTQKMRDLAQIERNKSDLLCHLCEQVPAQTDDQRQRHEAQYRAPELVRQIASVQCGATPISGKTFNLL